jgi:hypothetical protein
LEWLLCSPEEVARKILDEQPPADSSAAPASPARKPRSRWRMVLGGGLGVLAVLVCILVHQNDRLEALEKRTRQLEEQIQKQND